MTTFFYIYILAICCLCLCLPDGFFSRFLHCPCSLQQPLSVFNFSLGYAFIHTLWLFLYRAGFYQRAYRIQFAPQSQLTYNVCVRLCTFFLHIFRIQRRLSEACTLTNSRIHLNLLNFNFFSQHNVFSSNLNDCVVKPDIICMACIWKAEIRFSHFNDLLMYQFHARRHQSI